MAGRVGKDSLIHQVRDFDSNNVETTTADRVKEILGYHDLSEVRIASNGAATFHVWVSTSTSSFFFLTFFFSPSFTIILSSFPSSPNPSFPLPHFPTSSSSSSSSFFSQIDTYQISISLLAYFRNGVALLFALSKLINPFHYFLRSSPLPAPALSASYFIIFYFMMTKSWKWNVCKVLLFHIGVTLYLDVFFVLK